MTRHVNQGRSILVYKSGTFNGGPGSIWIPQKKNTTGLLIFFLFFFFGTTCKKIGKSRVHTWATTPCQATVGSTFTTCSLVLTSCFPQGRKWISLLGFNSYIVKVNAHSRIFLNVLKTCKHCVHVCARSVEAERSTQEHGFLSEFFVIIIWLILKVIRCIII